MKRNARITFRSGDFYLTEIDERQTTESIAQRMTHPPFGFLICEDERWGEKRTIVINLADVRDIVIEDAPLA